MKNKIWYVIFGFVLLTFQTTEAQHPFDIIQANYANARLSYEQYLVYSALSIFDPAQLPPEFQLETAGLPIKSGTFIMAEIKANWDRISSQYQTILTSYFQRPQLPYQIVSPSKRFRIHYATQGQNKVNTEDRNRNSIPDYVESVAEYFDHSHYVIVDSLGYKAPPPDSSGAGKTFDIYLMELYRTYGITYLEENVPGNADAYSCYIEVDNDFSGFETPPLQSIMVTSAHEYFHAVQVGYHYRDEDVFFMEMCSTWMEDFVYDEVNDYRQYVVNFFNNINYPFYYTNGSWFEYASCLWIHMIVKKYNPDVIRKIWELIPPKNALTAIQEVLLKYGTTFNRELTSFGLWNYFTGSRANNETYYKEGDLYPEVKFNREYDIQEQVMTFTDKIRKLSSAYYHIYDTIHGNDIGLIVTNFAIPQKNYLTTDRDSLSISVIAISDIQQNDSTFFQKNNLIKLTDNIGIKMGVKYEENWFARAVVIDRNYNDEIVQFFPPFFIYESGNQNYINNIYPNPFVIDPDQPLFINYVVTDFEAGELVIYTTDGRLVFKDEFDASFQNYHISNWNGRNLNGELVSSGIYIVLLRVGGFVNMKKLAVVRE